MFLFKFVWLRSISFFPYLILKLMSTPKSQDCLSVCVPTIMKPKKPFFLLPNVIWQYICAYVPLEDMIRIIPYISSVFLTLSKNRATYRFHTILNFLKLCNYDERRCPMPKLKKLYVKFNNKFRRFLDYFHSLNLISLRKMILPSTHIAPAQIGLIESIGQYWPQLESITIFQKRLYLEYWKALPISLKEIYCARGMYLDVQHLTRFTFLESLDTDDDFHFHQLKDCSPPLRILHLGIKLDVEPLPSHCIENLNCLPNLKRLALRGARDQDIANYCTVLCNLSLLSVVESHLTTKSWNILRKSAIASTLIFIHLHGSISSKFQNAIKNKKQFPCLKNILIQKGQVRDRIWWEEEK